MRIWISMKSNHLVALLADVHFGYGSIEFLNSQLRFFREIFIPYCKKHGIKKIIQFGDLFENRRSLDIYVKNIVFDLFKTELKDFEIYIYLGNHDVYYKNSNEIHSLKFLSQFSNVRIIEQISEINFYGRKFLFVPWLYDLMTFRTYVNENDVSDIDVCFGHFDIIGSKMSKKAFSKSGLTKEILFKNFKKTFSGHYHSRSIEKIDDSEIIYTGMPYQLNRGDEGEERGFCVLDCDTLKYKFIENDVSIKYISVKYPDTLNENQVKGNVIDVYISNKGNIDTDEIQNYIDDINKFKPAQEPTKRYIDEFESENIGEIKIKNLKEMFDEYIGQLQIDDDIKKDVVSELALLYEECQKDF